MGAEEGSWGPEVTGHLGGQEPEETIGWKARAKETERDRQTQRWRDQEMLHAL